MQVPNWQKHSKKEQKRTLKPHMLRARREALQALKKKVQYISFARDSIRTA